MATRIHPSAIVNPRAEIGDDVEIGPFCFIDRSVVIGAGTRLHTHVTVYPYTTLGASCRVHAGAVLGDTPQDLGFKDVRSLVRIGNGCVLREGVTVHRGTQEDTETVIGDDCFLMAFSHAGHNTRVGQGVVMANGAVLGGYAEVGDRAFLSSNVAVHQFVKVGRLAMLGGNAGASKDVPPFVTLHGAAVNQVAGLNVVGMRRAAFSAEDRQQVKEAFRLLYRSGLNTTQAVARIRASGASGPALEFCTFAENSTRGLCGMRSARG